MPAIAIERNRSEVVLRQEEGMASRRRIFDTAPAQVDLLSLISAAAHRVLCPAGSAEACWAAEGGVAGKSCH